MNIKKGKNKKGEFSLNPIKLNEPIKMADGFSNLVDTPEISEKAEKSESEISIHREETKRDEFGIENVAVDKIIDSDQNNLTQKSKINELKENTEANEISQELVLSESELLRILDAKSFDEIYELSDVLRASSLKLYTTLVRLADSRGRVRVKNHELMSKAGIKGIATLYKQERWLMDLKLLEKKAKPGPHDGSSYVVSKLETLPLPLEIYEKFDKFLQDYENTI